MTTPHFGAEPGAFAPIVILPDDPVQARLIAERCLDSPRQVTAVRNMLGFTGEYKGRAVSVMGGGIGIPSVSIYARELFVEYGVEAIISIGECHAVNAEVAVRDLVLAMGACTFSGVNRQRFGGGDFSAICDFELLRQAWASAVNHSISVQIGNVCSVDVMSISERVLLHPLRHMGVLGLEMNAAGLYGVAAECGRRALALCAVCEHMQHGDALPSDDRERGLRKLAQVALDIVESYYGDSRQS